MRQARCILGDELWLGVRCTTPAGVATAPDAAPVMKVYTEAGTLVITKSLPPVDRYGTTGLFGLRLPINNLFSEGRHFAMFDWVISSTAYAAAEPTYFEIKPGGHTDGQVIAMAFLERPDGGDWIVHQDDQGHVRINRGPRV